MSLANSRSKQRSETWSSSESALDKLVATTQDNQHQENISGWWGREEHLWRVAPSWSFERVDALATNTCTCGWASGPPWPAHSRNNEIRRIHECLIWSTGHGSAYTWRSGPGHSSCALCEVHVVLIHSRNTAPSAEADHRKSKYNSA
jgi:hypothetical protein